MPIDITHSHSIVQHNVRSLKSTYIRTCAHTLFLESSATFQFLQETRTSHTGIRKCAQSIVCSSSANSKGAYGCEIWINSNKPIALLRNKPVFLEKSHLTLLAAEPRLLVVGISHPQLSLLLVSAHVPHLNSDDRVPFLSHMHHTLDIYTHKFSNTYIGIDANTTFPPLHDDSAPFADLGASKPSRDHSLLSSIARKLSLVAVNSHSMYCTPDYIADNYTFTNPAKTHTTCIDYILVSTNASPLLSSVNRDWALSHHDEVVDHVPISASIRPVFRSDSKVTKRRALAYDPSLIGSPTHDHAFCDMISALPHVAYSHDQSSHLRTHT